MDYLPVELQTSILKFLLAISRAPDLAHPFLSIADLDSPITRWKWIDDDPRKQSLFPFNAASVCKLWRDILTRIPECWTLVVFDVAQDPGPFLEAFLWSKNLDLIEVVVFNSSGPSSDPEELQQELEKTRVSSIIRALSPHILRCRSIEFDVIYSSSLPSPTIFFLQDLPNIEKISLNCRLDDIVVETRSCTTVGHHERTPLANSFPKLGMLSLTGFWFMYLALAAGGPQWFQELELESPFLYISQFQFLDEGQYTMENFVSFLSMLTCDGYIFRNLSLSYTFDDTILESDKQYEISGSINFINVSHDFQVHLYAISEMDLCYGELHFDACQIPELLESQFRLGNSLFLDNIDGESLRHILEVWCGEYIQIRSCPSFDDTLLAWLGTKVEFAAPTDNQTIKMFYVPRLRSFSIEDCPNITPRAIQDFVKARNAATLAGQVCGHESTIRSLFVHGKVPLLSQEDKDWFFEIANIMDIGWLTYNNDGSYNYFVTHRPAISRY